MQFGLTLTAGFARIVLVGTPDNVAIITSIRQTIFRAELRSFALDQKEVAWRWFEDGELLYIPTN